MTNTRLKIVGLFLALAAAVGLAVHSTDAVARADQSAVDHAPLRVTLQDIPFGDGRGGIQLEVSMSSGRFQWAAPAASKKHVAGEGYALLILDGHEAGHLSSPVFAITDMQGKTAVDTRVRLMRNDHQPYRDRSGSPIEASVTVRN